MAKKSHFNPFYVLLLLLGIAFTLTACAYGVMAFKAIAGPPPGQKQRVETPAGAALLAYLDKHGAQLMAGELIGLAVATFLAMATDRYWSRGGGGISPAAAEKASPTSSTPPA